MILLYLSKAATNAVLFYQGLVQHFTSAFEETKWELDGVSSDMDATPNLEV